MTNNQSDEESSIQNQIAQGKLAKKLILADILFSTNNFIKQMEKTVKMIRLLRRKIVSE